MPVTPILPVSFDALQAVALGLRDGRMLEARITEVLSAKLARIEIAGQPLLVTMTGPLPVGAMLTLKVEREAGKVMLIAQGPAREMPRASIRAPTPQRTPYSFAEPVKAALAKIQAMTVNPMPEDGPAAEPTLTQILASMARPPSEAVTAPRLPLRMPLQPGQTDAAPSGMPATSGQDAPDSMTQMLTSMVHPQGEAVAAPRLPLRMPLQPGQTDAAPSGMPATSAQDAPDSMTQMLTSMANPQGEAVAAPRPPPGAPLPHGRNDGAPPAMLAASGQDAPASGERGAVRAEGSDFRQVHVASDALAAHGRTERTAVFTVEIPVFLPGSAVPLRLHVTQHEEAAKQNDEEPHSPYWTVRFAAEAGRLGMVHAAISLIEGHIGVQLRAERQETAEQFKQNAPQLRDALRASDLKLDAVSVTQGGPLGDG